MPRIAISRSVIMPTSFSFSATGSTPASIFFIRRAASRSVPSGLTSSTSRLMTLLIFIVRTSSVCSPPPRAACVSKIRRRVLSFSLFRQQRSARRFCSATSDKADNLVPPAVNLPHREQGTAEERLNFQGSSAVERVTNKHETVVRLIVDGGGSSHGRAGRNANRSLCSLWEAKEPAAPALPWGSRRSRCRRIMEGARRVALLGLLVVASTAAALVLPLLRPATTMCRCGP